METANQKTEQGSVVPSYPFCGRYYAFKTLRCKLDKEDVSRERSAIDALFEQYGAAVRYYLRLVPDRGTCREAFTREDKAAVVGLTPGLDKDLRSSALDKAIEVWKSFKVSSKVPRSKNLTDHKGVLRRTDGSSHSGSIEDLINMRVSAVRFPKKDYFLLEGPDILGPVREGLRVSFPTPKGNIELLLMGQSHQAQVLRTCMKGTQRLTRCIGELLWRGSDLYIDIHIGRPMGWIARTFPVIASQEEIPVPVGVDIGTRKLLVAAVPGRGRQGVLFIDGGKLRHKRRCIVKNKEQAYYDEDLGSYIEARKEDVAFVRDFIHKAARALVEHAKKFSNPSKSEFSFIVLEDLKFQDRSQKTTVEEGKVVDRPLRTDIARELKGWPFGALRTVIIEKAAWDSVPVMFVPPQGTSTSCPKCGSLQAIRRQDLHRLECHQCGFQANDDYCAALNIANRGLQLLPIMDRRALRARSAIASYKHQGATGPVVAGDVDAPQDPLRQGCGGTSRA
jgi:IS605 OrfB family transposase